MPPAVATLMKATEPWTDEVRFICFTRFIQLLSTCLIVCGIASSC